MAAPIRKQSADLRDALFQRPYEFEFPKALSLLEGYYADKAAIASTSRSDQEALRLKGNFSLSSPPSDLFSLEEPLNSFLPAEMVINFMGISGQTGPLPNVYGELLIDRVKAKDYAFRDFLDVFNNRLAGIHYRIRVKNTLGLTRKLPDQNDVSEMLRHLGGAPKALTSSVGIEGTNIESRSFLKYAGLLYPKPRSATALQTLLRDYFGLPFEVEQFQGFWSRLDPSQWTKIGKSGFKTPPHKRGQQNVLGQSAALGTKAWVHGDQIALKIQGLDLDLYLDMLPGQSQNKRVSEVARQFLGRDQSFSYEIGLRSNQASPTRLDGKSALGWTSWLKDAPEFYTPVAIRIKADDPLS